jgi:MtfA peptidase
MNIFKRARVRYILHRHAIPHRLWQETEEKLAILQGLTAVEKAHLRELTTLLLHEKNFVGAQGLALSGAMRVIIAVQACLPILQLGLGCLSGWSDVIVYPGAFRVSRDSTDEAGVVHHREQVLIGEAWSRGPLIVSWADVERDMLEPDSGHNVVIHEIAHKLDALNGSGNGFPPLHGGMSIPQWTEAFSEAYRRLVEGLEHHHYNGIDPYAATNPGEFFAVISEYFFCSPETLHTHFAEVYRQLQLYYRQDPMLRRCSLNLAGINGDLYEFE